MEVGDSIETLLHKGIKFLLSLDKRYLEGNIEDKRKIIGSMYPGKLGFDGLRLRTNRVNEIAMYIYKVNKELSNKKAGQMERFPICPARSSCRDNFRTIF